MVFRYLKSRSFVQGASKIKNDMARPTKLTPEVQENICNWLKLGYYQEDAAIMAGISASTYYEWIKKGEQERVALEEGEKAQTLPDTSLPAPEDGTPEIELVYPFLEFSEAVKKARAEAEGAHIRNIRKAADNGVWQASAWFLERSHPKKWGKRNTLELNSGTPDEPIQFDISYGD